jgi:hypothetical protein
MHEPEQTRRHMLAKDAHHTQKKHLPHATHSARTPTYALAHSLRCCTLPAIHAAAAAGFVCCTHMTTNIRAAAVLLPQPSSLLLLDYGQ